MWNRLGSSLSNAGKPEEALSAYREALHLRPTYTRAIYNVGVACTFLFWKKLVKLIYFEIGLNIGAFKEGAEHFLSALAMQEGTGSGSSDQIWSTLRRALGLMVSRGRVMATPSPS